MMKELGIIKEIGITKIFQREERDFTPWLADNIEQLNDILGVDIVDVEKEQPIGDDGFHCDILCRDANTNKVILIENQYGKTNHDHLGKSITYASGLKANIIVWITEEARSSHQEAVQWLNEHTDENVDFFLLEVHAIQIDDSKPAIKFNVIEQPNSFVKATKNTVSTVRSAETFASKTELWNLIDNELDKLKANCKLKYSNSFASDKYLAIGDSRGNLFISLANKFGKVKVGYWIHQDKDLFDKLYDSKDLIEAEMQESLVWNRKDDAKMSSIQQEIPGLDFNDKSNFNELAQKIAISLHKFKTIFIKHIKGE